MARIAIVGSGFKGIIDSLLLSKNDNNQITIFEKSSIFGGISRSKRILGFNVDSGVHMFDSVQKELFELINELMNGEVHSIDFNSRSSYNNVVTKGFGLPDLSSCDNSIKKKITQELIELAAEPENSSNSIKNSQSLHSLFINKYGKTAGDIFSSIFEKVYNIKAKECDKNALNRTSLGRLKYLGDEEMKVLKSNNYLDNHLAARRSTIGKVDDYVSFYPSDGNAMGGFCDKAYQVLKDRGVEINLEANIKIINSNHSLQIQHENTKKEFDHIIWAADRIDPLLQCLNINESIDSNIHHTPMIFAIIKTERESVEDFTYMQNFSKGSIAFRSSATGVYSNQINSKGETFITVECPASKEKLNYINHPETIQCIWNEVKDIKIIDSTAKLIDYKLIPIPSSFKVPMLGFSDTYEKVMDQILPLRNKISLHSPKLFFRRELYQECLELTSNFV